MSHIRVVLETKEPEEIKKARKSLSKGKAIAGSKREKVKRTRASRLRSTVRKRITRSKSKKAVVHRRSTEDK